VTNETIVRAVLLPASMKLLGERSWYLRQWLEWLPRTRMHDFDRGSARTAVAPAKRDSQGRAPGSVPCPAG
jgi:RND superfamily putative drug exporter